MIGVLVFLLLVLLMYRAALSPSTVGAALDDRINQLNVK